MTKPITQENKYKSWVMTVNEMSEIPFPSPSDIESILKTLADRWLFQKEKVNNNHYQCCFTSKNRTRKSTLLNTIKSSTDFDIRMFTIDQMRGTWEENESYCSKSESRVGEQHSSEERTLEYNGDDIGFLDDKENRYPWQQEIINQLVDEDSFDLKPADDRTIVWIYDPAGNNGKSKFVKWFYCRFNYITKISFGTANQLRSALISVGAKKVYFIDIPRTLGPDDSITAILSAIEDLKNGFITSSFYGKGTTLLMDPPHIIVFSNHQAPTNTLSQDRWISYLVEKDSKSLSRLGDCWATLGL